MQALKFVPRWPGAIHGHAVNSVKSFYPNLCAEHEFDDLMQEAYYIFLKCKRKYFDRPNFKYAKVNSAPWFMSLFSRALRNQLIAVQSKCRYKLNVDIDSIVDHSKFDALCVEQQSGPASVFLKEGQWSLMFAGLDPRVRWLVHAMCFGDEVSSDRAMQVLRRRYLAV